MKIFVCVTAFSAFGSDQQLCHPRLFSKSKVVQIVRHWLEGPFPLRNYEVEEFYQNPRGGRMALRKHPFHRDLIIIDEGRLFSRHLESDEQWRYISGISKVSAVFVLEDTLIALRKNGTVYLEERFYGTWVEIMDSARQVLSMGRDLVALKGDVIWLYKGVFDTINLIPVNSDAFPIQQLNYSRDKKYYTFIPLPVNPIERKHPALKGLAMKGFLPTQVEGVVDLSPFGDSDIKITYRDGSQTYYSQLLQ